MSVASTDNREVARQDPSSSNTYELNRRRVYIFPTRHGFSFYAVLTVMLIGSINYNNSLGFLLTFLLGSLSLVAILHTYRNLAGLNVRARPARSVFAGQETKFALQFDNRAGDERIGITVSSSMDPQEEQPRLSLANTNIPPDSFHSIEIKTQTTRRGRLHLGRIVIASRFPLGLFRAAQADVPYRPR